MPKFSNTSQARLDTCHPDIQRVMNRAIKIYDFSVIEGVRSEQTHLAYIRRGVTRVSYEQTKHRRQEDGYSHAIDIAPYPIDWKDTPRFFLLAGIILACAAIEGVKLRWGGDWDGDHDFKDQSFNDYVHFERVEP